MKSQATLAALALMLAAAAAQAQSSRAEGEVQGINRDSSRVVLKHGALKAVDLPASTGSYKVRDTALLAKLNPGDKVVFTLENSPTGPVVTRIEKK